MAGGLSGHVILYLISRAPMLLLALVGALFALKVKGPQFAPLSQLPPTITVQQARL